MLGAKHSNGSAMSGTSDSGCREKPTVLGSEGADVGAAPGGRLVAPSHRVDRTTGVRHA